MTTTDFRTPTDKAKDMTPWLGPDVPPSPEDLDECRDWPERLSSMVTHHSGSWQKFGHWASKRGVQNTASNVKRYFEQMGYPEEGWEMAKRYAEEEKGWAMWLRVRKLPTS